MALVKCEECGHMISDRATRCPKCGCPVEKKTMEEVPIPRVSETVAHQPPHRSGSGKKVAIGLLSIAVVAAIGVCLFLLPRGKDLISKKDVVVGEHLNTINGHEYVDLGLSVMWATCNVGASSPEEYGDYFVWGETSPKSEYTEKNSKTYEKSIGGIVGNSAYDVARANWGGTWRLPTADEIDELVDGCDLEWTSQGGHNGYKITGSNGNSIFLPAAGWRDEKSLRAIGERGNYWSAVPHNDYASSAYALFFDSCSFYGGWGYRNGGMSVRPVASTTDGNKSMQKSSTSTSTGTGAASSDSSPISQSSSSTTVFAPTGYINGHTYVDLGLSVKWATCNVGASSPEEYGDYFAWGETSTKSSYNEGNSKTYGEEMGSIAGNSQYDAARANWGGTWRLPTESELDELVDKCSRRWMTLGGHKGYKITGPNGNCIFLPATGWRESMSLRALGERGNYWSAVPDGGGDAYGLLFTGGYFSRDWTGRYFGLPVRPVSN